MVRSMRPTRVVLRAAGGALVAAALATALAPQVIAAGGGVAAWRLRPEGGLLGALRCVTSRGDHAFVGAGAWLVAFDLRSPGGPRELGHTAALGGLTRSLRIDGDYVYVVSGPDGGLRVVDVARPASPALVGGADLPGPVTDLALIEGPGGAGRFAVVSGSRQGIWVIEVTDPRRPEVVGELAIPWGGGELAAFGRLAVVGEAGGPELALLDLGNPRAPRVLGSYTLDDHDSEVDDVAFDGRHAFVADWDWGLWVLDMADPAAIRVLTRHVMPGEAGSLFLAGGLAYVLDGEGLRVVDVRDPSDTAIVGELPLSTPAWDLWVEGPRALLVGPELGLRVIDVADPGRPTEVAAWLPPPTDGQLDMDDGLAYVAAGDAGLLVVDVASPMAPRRLSVTRLPAYAANVTVSGGQAYVTGGMDETLTVVDVRDPRRPKLLFSGGTGGFVNDARVSADRAYLAAGQVGLRILDVTDPARPLPLGIHPVADASAVAVEVAPPRAYLSLITAAADGQLQVLDVSDPRRPALLGAVETAATRLLALAGDRVYGAADGALWVTDVADPRRPAVLGRAELLDGDWIFDLVATGPYAWLGLGSSGLALVDAGDPRQPVLLLPPGGEVIAQGLGVEGRTVVTTGDGLSVLRAAPIVTRRVAVAGGYLESWPDGTRLSFPAGSFAEAVTVTLAAAYPDEVPGAGERRAIDRAFSLSAVSVASNRPLQAMSSFGVEAHYHDAERRAIVESSLGLHAWDGAAWTREPTSAVLADENQVTAAPSRLGTFAILGETHRVFLPDLGR